MNANVSSSAEPTRIRWKIFGVLFLLVVVNMIDRASISIAMPTIAQELNLSGVMQGLVLSGFFWTYALMQIPSGLIADKFGPRSTVSISTVLWGASQALLGLCHNGIALIGARLLLGASEAPVFPAGARLNAIWLNKKERARGAVLMDAGGPFGAALGGILVAELRTVNFIDALVAVLTLQNTLIMVEGTAADGSAMLPLTAVSSGAIYAVIVAVTIRMLQKGLARTRQAEKANAPEWASV